jgi:thiamine-phosphate pyrophosphorylase
VGDLPRLYLITDRRRNSGPSLLEALDDALRAGVRLVQIRERDLPAADLLALAERAVVLAEARGARVLVNDRADIAILARAAGVHLRAASLPVAAARRLVGPTRLIGASVHSPAEARAASDAGADFVLFGPVFATPDKARFRPPQGLAELRLAARAASVPLFAVGGVTPENAADCLAAGAHGVATIGGVFAAPSAGGAAAAYFRALSKAGARRRRRAV